MQFDIKEKGKINKRKYVDEDYTYAKKFVQILRHELGTFLKAAVLFGSVAREEKPLYGERDIDVLIVVDDLTQVLSPEVVQSYRVITEQTAAKVSKRLHITTLKLTSFWDYVKNGDPIAINLLRDGVSLFDSGFFEPLQQLLHKGSIRPTKESIWMYFARAPNTLTNADWHILQGVVDLYWAVVDAAHAALMSVGEVPPTPGHLSGMIQKKLVDTGMVTKKYTDVMKEFYDLNKQITHRELTKMKGMEYDEYKKEAKDFVKKMQEVVKKHQHMNYF